MRRLLILIPIAIVLLSCFEQGDCSDVSSNLLHVTFYEGSKTKKILLDSVKLDGLDALIYENKDSTAVALPLDVGKTSCTFRFFYDDSETDLTVEYAFKTFALAPGCNAIDLITITDANVGTDQDLTIVQPKLTSSNAENIKLSF